MNARRIASAWSALLLAAGLPAAAGAKDKWTVKGKVTVSHVLPELTHLLGPSSGVAGITVKVSARSALPFGLWGTWNSWGTVKTGSDGSFQVSEQHGDDRRQFKVEILFDSDRLRVKQGGETSLKLDSTGFPIDLDLDLTPQDWHEIFDDKNGGATGGRKAGVTDLGAIPISASVVKKHADLWTLYGMVLDLFAGYGADYKFASRVVVKYPMGIGNGAAQFHSYSNPLNHHVYVKESEFHARTMIHELLHRWAYDHSSGEDSMVWQLAKHLDTHQTRENTTFVPFHEAFAEWGAYQVLKGISGGKVLNFSEDVVYKYPFLPLTRDYVGDALGKSERVLANVDYTERGWHSLFNLLTHPFLDRCDLNRPFSESPDDKPFAYVILLSTTSCPEVRTGYAFKDVLSVFLKYPTKGIASPLKKDEMDFRHFLDRAGAVLPGLESAKIQQLKSYLDPKSSKNPCSA